MLQLDTFSAIPVFVCVVEQGSFSAAAQHQGITKSAVSKRIAQLELSLGTRLLHRTTRSLRLTEAGEQYYACAQAAVMKAQEGEDRLAQQQKQPSGQLKVTVPMTFGRLHVAPLIPEFLKAYPEIRLDLSMEDAMVDMVEGGFDLAIRIGHIPESSLIARKIAPCRSVLCASPEYIAQHGMPQSPADLRHHNCLYYSFFRGGAEWRFDGPTGIESVQPQGNYRVNNSEALREALLHGTGICQMPTFIVGPDLAAGKLVPVMTDYALPVHAIYAMFPERKHLPAKVRVLIDFLLLHLGTDHPAWDALPRL
ncbi:LysR family transcriptional regulator (plasmid) [Photobacterium sp. GJ3]|uniref:LysR family transcriptional regulator n=1 Tax=Photobacterium sp. GJ3 TaxID=2829502 RepID=UPI001B8CBF32|nr:LysR family transcriptional regulator [Photobacterium sp. GJ3]QUJ70116.1 LysR family transcriptional regulator [Photobacterium sp. GJ3]